MELKQGIATRIRNTVEISGGHNSSVSTTHITLFYIDNTPVKLMSPQPSFINEGDSITISGHVKNGVFIAIAYNNTTTGVFGDRGVAGRLILGVLFFIIGMSIMNFWKGDFFGYFPTIIGALFSVIGVAAFYSGIVTINAKNLLNQHVKT